MVAGPRLTPYEMAIRIYNMVSRVTLTKADDSPKMQEHSIEGLAGEKMTNVERFQTYGHSTVPHPEDPQGDPQKVAEGIMLSIGGARDHPVIISMDDRRFRVGGLKEGESIMHDEQGHQSHIGRGGMTHSAPNDKTHTEQVMQDPAGTPDKPITSRQHENPTYSTRTHSKSGHVVTHPAMDQTNIGDTTHTQTPDGHDVTGTNFQMKAQDFTHYGGKASIGVDDKHQKPVRLLTTDGPHPRGYGKKG